MHRPTETTLREAASHYASDGYCVVPGLVPQDLIEAVLSTYRRDILPSRDFFYRQAARWERNHLSRHGYVRNPFMGLHTYDHPTGPASPKAPMAMVVRNLLCAEPFQWALTAITGAGSHRLMQSMLFDLNAETEAHQDAYYLDSLPNGHLIAAWIALEDIHPDAGRFFVLPGSQRTRFEMVGQEAEFNAVYLAKLHRYVAAHQESVTSPALLAGDVLFWNSMTVHGALPTRDPAHSRKSLTAHYLPDGYEFGSIHSPTPMAVSYSSHGGMEYRLVPYSDAPGVAERAYQAVYRATASMEANSTVYRAALPVRRALRRLRGRAGA